MATARLILPAPPLLDVLHDEEVLAGTDVAEEPLLGRQRRRRRRLPELPLEGRLLALELLDLREPLGTLRARREVVMQRPVVEEPHEDENGDRDPTAPYAQPRTAAGRSRSHSSEISRAVTASL